VIKNIRSNFIKGTEKLLIGNAKLQFTDQILSYYCRPRLRVFLKYTYQGDNYNRGFLIELIDQS